MNYKDKRVAVLGYGIEGRDAEKFLKKAGAKVTILDQIYDKDYLSYLDNYEIIVRSPGVYRYKKELVNAQKKGVRVTSPIHIFFDEFKGTIIGVTGTKGKGTTSTLIYKILKKANFDVYLAGNIGIPFLSLLPKLKRDSYVILEMSSFQLIDLPLSPDISVILNITSDHMDWHKNQKEYVEAKQNMVRFQNKSDWAVINNDYPVPRSFSKLTKASTILFSKKSLESDFKKGLLLRGEHNLENIAAAVAVAKILNVKKDTIISVVRGFRGLEHRLELVGNVKGVSFYNDSFATGPQPTIAAINSFTQSTTLILGGSDKGLDYTKLGKEISKRKNVENVVLIGKIRKQIEKSLVKEKYRGRIIDLGTSSMSMVVKAAFGITPKGGVVILSPAAASFDMFENYKDRGNKFKKAVGSFHE